MNFNNICRACLASKDDLYNIFLNATSEMYTFCTSVRISENDILPKHLCHFCYELLNKFYNFKQKCIQSDERLLQYIESQEDIKPPVAVDCDIKVDIFEELLVSTSKSNDITINKIESFADDQTISGGKLPDFLTNDNSHDNSSNGDYSPPEDNSDKLFVVRKKNKRQKKLVTKNKKLRVKQKKNYKESEDESKSNKAYRCQQCNKKFSYMERLEAHQLTHQGVENDISCNLCDKKFKQWDGLRRHRKFVHMAVGKTLECPTCGKLYKTEMTLKNHLKIHQERKSFVCHICGRSFHSAGGLQNHVETHKVGREKNYECKICNKKFVSNNYLTSHMFRHKERRFVCTVCRFPFFTQGDLNRHLLIHRGIKPFVCEICSKAYSTKSFLIEHGRTHSGERPFACDYCAMNFISKRRLIDHQRTHTGEKPHKCDKCNQAFIQRGSLTRHLRVHARRKYADAAAPTEHSPDQFPPAPMSPKKFDNKITEEESILRMALGENKLSIFK